PCPAADNRRAPPSHHRPAPARHSAERSDGVRLRPVPPEKRMARPGRPTASAPARPGSPAPFASGQSRAKPPNPPRSSPIRSPFAVPPRLQTSLPNQSAKATSHVEKIESWVRDWIHGIDELDRCTALWPFPTL